MDKREKWQSMEKMLRELEDVKNSQTSVLKKIAQIEADNMNAGISLLDSKLPDIHGEVDDAIIKIDELITEFGDHRDKFVKDNKLDVEEVSTV